MALQLTTTLPANTSIGRWGGEEFILLFEQITLADAQILAEKVRLAIASSPVIFETQVINISTSIGIASNRDLNAHSTDPLLAAADEALYRAKDNGRNRVEVANT